MIRQILYIFWKDIQIEKRAWSRMLALLSFAVMTLLLFSFAVGPNTEVLRRHAAGYLWLGALFSSSSLFASSFRIETESSAMEQLILTPVSTIAIFYGKALANTVQLLLVLVVMLPFLIAICDVQNVYEPWMLFVTLFLGALGLSGPGALYAAMTSKISSQQIVLPILLYPLIIPALLSAVKATSLSFMGDPMSQMSSWLQLLVAFDLVYWALCGILFDKIVD